MQLSGRLTVALPTPPRKPVSVRKRPQASTPVPKPTEAPKRHGQSEDDKARAAQALDEIRVAYETLQQSRIPVTKRKNLEAWIRRMKRVLKAAGYRGKIPRKPRSIQ